MDKKKIKVKEIKAFRKRDSKDIYSEYDSGVKVTYAKDYKDATKNL